VEYAIRDYDHVTLAKVVDPVIEKDGNIITILLDRKFFAIFNINEVYIIVD
jgi:hypothetical protein